MRAADIMTPRVLTIRSDATVMQAIRIMLQNHVSGLPVVDANGKLAGIVTEGDFLRRAEIGTESRRSKWLELLLGPGRAAQDYVHTHTRKIAEIMTTDVVTVDEAKSVDDVVRLMEQRRIKRVVVMRGGQIAGIISRQNLLHALARVIGEVKPAAASDHAIRTSILAEMDKLQWSPAASVNVVVRAGVVGLHGVIMDDRQRTALRVLAENTAGVSRVDDQLVWVDANSGYVIEGSAEKKTPDSSRISRAV